MFRVKYRDSIGNWHNKAMIIIVDSKFIEKENERLKILSWSSLGKGVPIPKKTIQNLFAFDFYTTEKMDLMVDTLWIGKTT